MQKDFEKIYEEVYDSVKNWDTAASELSMIVHMSQELSKKEIVVRCTAIRNALWDLEEEKTKEEIGAME